MARTTSPFRQNPGPFDKMAGIAAQFERSGDGFVYRRDGHGPAIPVSREEHDAFVRAGARATMYHLAALALCVAAAWLVATRVTVGADAIVFALVFATFSSAAAALLLVSHDWHRVAPARALSGRSAIRPPRARDGGAGYGTIAGVMAIAVLWLFTGSIGTPAFRTFFAMSALLIGAFLVARRLLARRHLNPAQRKQAAAAKRATATATTAAIGAGCAMLLFVLVETVVGGAALFGTLALVLKIAGEPLSDPNGWVFAAGFLLGGGLAYLVMRRIDRLCRRWTGLSAIDAFDWLPVHW